MSKTILYYVHDPMCSWCWGFRPTWTAIQNRLPQDIEVRYVVGGLAPDNDQPMDAEMQEMLQGAWRKIEGMLGTSFNFEFWTRCQPRRSTYPSCRAVIAADRQDKGGEMLFAIQRAYFLRALNPSDTQTHRQLAQELGLDVAQFEADLKSAETEAELMRQIQLAQELTDHGFPSLVLEVDGKSQYFHHDYLDADVSLNKIEKIRAEFSAAKQKAG